MDLQLAGVVNETQIVGLLASLRYSHFRYSHFGVALFYEENGVPVVTLGKNDFLLWIIVNHLVFGHREEKCRGIETLRGHGPESF